jgi:hypothetical protein
MMKLGTDFKPVASEKVMKRDLGEGERGTAYLPLWYLTVLGFWERVIGGQVDLAQAQ